MKHVMDIAVKCVNKIRARSLNRREFRQFLIDDEEKYGELLIHCEVRWLSKGPHLQSTIPVWGDKEQRIPVFL